MLKGYPKLSSNLISMIALKNPESPEELAEILGKRASSKYGEQLMKDLQGNVDVRLTIKDLIIEELLNKINEKDSQLELKDAQLKIKDKQITEHLEIIQKLITTNMGPIEPLSQNQNQTQSETTTSGGATSSTETKEKIKHVVLEKISEDAVKVYGNTFNHKNDIKSVGGSWNPGEKCWMIPAKSLNEIVEIFKKNNIDYKVIQSSVAPNTFSDSDENTVQFR